MTTALASALVTLVTVLTVIAFAVLIKLWNGDFDTKVKSVNAKAEDNIFTKVAAEEQRKAAQAALETAKVNQRTEEIRLERTRLEKTG